MPASIDAFARTRAAADALALSRSARWASGARRDAHELSANMLGIDNAATPMGLKAMEELQTLNPVKDTATNSMVLFLAINNSSVTIIPFTLIGYRVASGSTNPAQPVRRHSDCDRASARSLPCCITKWLSRRRGYRIAAAGGSS